MTPTKGTAPRSGARDEAEQLAREVTRDAVHAAYVGYRIVSRVGRAALRASERAANDLLEQIR
ncbi:MAG: hypothetical protein L3K07_07325 [Thermoplasmata archaeon]|nr:hypothetical protein [Thermoplasmata archaeon]